MAGRPRPLRSFVLQFGRTYFSFTPKELLMKKIILTLAAICCAGHVFAGEWMTSLPKATAKAAKENKLVLMDFTGSDWCGWCMKLDEETFSKPEFLEFAKKHLVLVTVDFPAKKEQSAELKQANEALQKKYEVQGFPTIVVLKPDGTVLWKKVGYLQGGPEAMIHEINAVMPKGAAANFEIPAQAPEAATAGDSSGKPKLQGIFYKSAHATALVNGHTCAEGDSVSGMRVMKIERDRVTVEWNGKTEELTMN